MKSEIRAVEQLSGEVFIDVNDLIIHLLSEADHADSEIEVKTYKALAAKLTALRNQVHKGSKEHESIQKL